MKNIKVSLIAAIATHGFGSILLDFLIIWTVARNSDSITEVAFLIGSSLFFRSATAMFTGILVDSHNKKKLAIIASIISVVLVFMVGMVPLITQNIFVAVAVILINDLNNNLFSNSLMIMASKCLAKEEFIKYQATESIATRTLVILANILSGILLAFASNSLIAMLTALAFLISTIIIFVFIKFSENESKNIASNSIITGINNIAKNTIYSFKSVMNITFLRTFVIIMLLLNLAYGYIPRVLPVVITSLDDNPMALGLIRSAMAIGEIAGLMLVAKLGKYVSRLFKIGIGGSAICILLLIFPNPFILVVAFFLYGFFDSLTQPLFSYTVMSIEPDNRAKILAGIDTIILLSPILGIWLGTVLFENFQILLYAYLSLVFILALAISHRSSFFKNIIVSDEEN
ncbi:MAG: MFS transporter [Defluviitaleaceae bacterium]|nr:MFS transporter [Defluviitaleaceae bacterium]